MNEGQREESEGQSEASGIQGLTIQTASLQNPQKKEEKKKQQH